MKINNLLTLAVIVFCVLFYNHIPVYYRSLSYALSLTIKDLILMVLPVVIFSFILDVIIKMKAEAAKLLIALVVFIVASNAIAITVAYFVGTTFLPDVESFKVESENTLQPLWSLYIPQILPTQYAMPLSVVVGILMIFFLKEKSNAINKALYNASDLFLSKIVMPVIPLFIAGFILKICSDKMLEPIVDHYSYTFLLIAASSTAYLMIIYWLLTGRKIFSVIANMWPALVTAFSTMSSAITLPLLLVASEKNTNGSHVSNAILPPAVNFHVMGDAFVLTISFIAILFTFTGKVMSLAGLATYIAYFIMFRFATVGIPGSGVLVLLPIFEQHFGFSKEMLTLITALYVVFDPLQTALNIFGNGAFAIFFSKLFKAKK